MWSRSLKDPGYLEEISRLRSAIMVRLGENLLPPAERHQARSTG
jgi:hypothetical protein